MKTPLKSLLSFFGGVALFWLVFISSCRIMDRIVESRGVQLGLTIKQSQSDLRTIGNAFDRFHLENETYPLTPASGYFNDANAWLPGATQPANLSQPIVFIEPTVLNEYRDDFAPEQKPYRYYSNGKGYYILASNGPDRDIDFDVIKYDGDFSKLNSYTYNMSNGLRSSGDIIVYRKYKVQE